MTVKKAVPFNHPFAAAVSWINRDLHAQLNQIVHDILFYPGDAMAPDHPAHQDLRKLHKLLADAVKAVNDTDPIGVLNSAWSPSIPPPRRAKP